MSKLVLPGSIHFPIPGDGTAPAAGELAIQRAKQALIIAPSGLVSTTGIVQPTGDDMVKATQSRGPLSEEARASIKEAVDKGTLGQHGPTRRAGAGGMGLHPSALNQMLPVANLSIPVVGPTDLISQATMPGIVRASAKNLTDFAAPMSQADRRDLFERIERGAEDMQSHTVTNIR